MLLRRNNALWLRSNQRGQDTSGVGLQLECISTRFICTLFSYEKNPSNSLKCPVYASVFKKNWDAVWNGLAKNNLANNIVAKTSDIVSYSHIINQFVKPKKSVGRR